MIPKTWHLNFKNNYHVLLPVLFFLGLCFYCFRFFVDDTYINFIAAKNLIEFGRLSPNLEYNVNPTTANFQMLLAAFVYAVSGPDFLEPVLKLLGIAVGVGTLALVNATLLNLKVEKSFRFLTLTYLATAFPFVLWTSSAMDTVFDAGLIMVACYLWLKDIATDKGRALFLFSAFLLIMARLDFALISVILLIALIFIQGLSKQLMKQILIFYILPLFVMMLTLKLYYGTIIPTPIQKASLGLSAMFDNFLKFGGLYFLHFCRLNLNIISIFSVGLVSFWSFQKLKTGRLASLDIQLLALAAAIFSYFCYIISQGSVHMMFAFRFYTPLLPLLAVFLGYAFQLYGRKLPALSSMASILFTALLVLCLNFSTFFYGYYKNLNFSEIPGGDFTGMNNNHINGWIHLHEGMRHAGIYFGSLVPPGSKIFLGVAGIIPYFMDKAAYDNGLLGAPAVWKFDYVLNGCDSVRPVPAGFFRHEYKPVSPETLYYPNSSWCLRQVHSSSQPRLYKSAEDRLAHLPIHDITGYTGIVDMAADLDCRFFVENKMWDELVSLLNQLHSLSDTTTGQRELKGYGRYLPEEYRNQLNFLNNTLEKSGK